MEKAQKKEKSCDFSGLVAYPDKISNLISALQAWEKVSKSWGPVKLVQIKAEKDLHQH